MLISKVFSHNGWQYSMLPIWNWNPKTLIGYNYYKKKISDKFACEFNQPIAAEEFQEAEKLSGITPEDGFATQTEAALYVRNQKKNVGQ